jgi:hypothetical protein
MPINRPDAARVVMTVTPVANWPSAFLKASWSKLGGLARFIGSRSAGPAGRPHMAREGYKLNRKSCRKSAICPNFNGIAGELAANLGRCRHQATSILFSCLRAL